jgi:hypothetical protein
VSGPLSRMAGEKFISLLVRACVSVLAFRDSGEREVRCKRLGTVEGLAAEGDLAEDDREPERLLGVIVCGDWVSINSLRRGRRKKGFPSLGAE